MHPYKTMRLAMPHHCTCTEITINITPRITLTKINLSPYHATESKRIFLTLHHALSLTCTVQMNNPHTCIVKAVTDMKTTYIATVLILDNL